MIWEVFRQGREGAAFQHGGSLEAPNRDFAVAYAKEFYGRRAESFALWVVPRAAVTEVDEPYVAPVFDRDYRRVDGEWFFARRAEKHWYAADVLERPQAVDFDSWERPAGPPTLPHEFPTWAAFFPDEEST